ncbi:MAG: AmmeMemoRadiSam system protein B [Planctomycetes bacterium]|nr:AmmeMemoRadiSam system protein B [Planctomycetota bacterium]
MIRSFHNLPFLVAFLLISSAACEDAPSPPPSPRPVYRDVRKPAVARAFYPDSPAELEARVRKLLDSASGAEIHGTVLGLLSPHAGYVFSGPVAAASFRQVRGRRFDLVLILAPPHHAGLSTASVGAFDAYQTPLGLVPVDSAAAALLVKKGVPFVRTAHLAEHAIEVQLPFIQVLFPGTPVLPVLVGSDDPAVHRSLAEALFSVIKGRNCLVVVSSDLSHYPDSVTADAADRAFLAAVVSLKPDAVRSVVADSEKRYRKNNLVTAACGSDALLTAMLLLEKMGVDGAALLAYANSGSTPVVGDKLRTVGYGSVAFYRKGRNVNQDSPLSDRARAELLRIARDSMEAAVLRRKPSLPPPDLDELSVQRGVFVTLKTRGRLRGCIGTFTSDRPLWQEVRDKARSSTLEDPRFVGDRISARETKDVHIEISVLSPLRKTDDPLSIELGTHGIYIRRGYRTGVFLPQVAVEEGWSKEEFLSYCASHKAGLPPDAWKDPDTEVFTFTAEVFGETAE